MGVAGLFKKIKNGVKKVVNKVKEKVKPVVNKVINTGAKIVKKWADVNEKITGGVNKVLEKVGNVIPGVGKLVTGAGKIATGLWTKVYDKIGNTAQKVVDKTSNNSTSSSNSNISTNSNSNNTTKPTIKLPSIINGSVSPFQNKDNNAALQRDAMLKKLRELADKNKTTNNNNNNKVLNSQPDVIINNYYNRGPRRDYIQQRHPSNPYYNVREIGPRRIRQPPIINPQQPIDIQRRNYYYSKPIVHKQSGNARGIRNYNQYNSYSNNEAVSW